MKHDVLVVEDFREICDIYEAALSELDCQVRKVGTAMAALSAMRAKKPDLVILDVGLPDFSGWELLRVIRTSEEWKDTPVIVITADASQDSAAVGWSLGCTFHFTKPLVLHDLLTTVQRVLHENPCPSVFSPT